MQLGLHTNNGQSYSQNFKKKRLIWLRQIRQLSCCFVTCSSRIGLKRWCTRDQRKACVTRRYKAHLADVVLLWVTCCQCVNLILSCVCNIVIVTLGVTDNSAVACSLPHEGTVRPYTRLCQRRRARLVMLSGVCRRLSSVVCRRL